MSTVEPSAEAVPVLPRRGRRGRRLLKFLLGLTIVVVLAVGLLRVTSLWGIPDAPEPFDVAAFEAEAVPDDRNAAVLFARAYEMLDDGTGRRPFPPMDLAPRPGTVEGPETFAWIDAHRPALETWRRGTDRPDLRLIGKNLPRQDLFVDPHFERWLRLVEIEAGRLEAAGDLGGAWAWHKARLRAALLLGRRRGVMSRQYTTDLFGKAAFRARDWAAEPGMTAPLLRRAIADVEAMAPLHGTEADSLKAEYLAMMTQFDQFAAQPSFLVDAAASAFATTTRPSAGTTSRIVPPEPLRPAYAWIASLVEAEPERSRRIARMIFANWLVQADRKPADRPPTVSTYPLVFDEDAGPTPSLSPRELSRRAATAPYFAYARSGFAPPTWAAVADQWPTLYRADRVARADLILHLADRIYEIQTGKSPANVEALVGPVLPSLPEDYDPTGGAGPADPSTPKGP